MQNDKILTSFHHITTGGIDDTRDLPQHNKSNSQQDNSQYQPKWSKIKIFLQKQEKDNVTHSLPSPYLFNIILDVLA